MATRYRLVKMPMPIYEKYDRIRCRMVNDIKRYTGKEDIKLSMPKAMNAIVSPYFNENFIDIDLRKLSALSRQKKGKYEL